jgi:hypothetical protein
MRSEKEVLKVCSQCTTDFILKSEDTKKGEVWELKAPYPGIIDHLESENYFIKLIAIFEVIFNIPRKLSTLYLCKLKLSIFQESNTYSQYC